MALRRTLGIAEVRRARTILIVFPLTRRETANGSSAGDVFLHRCSSLRSRDSLGFSLRDNVLPLKKLAASIDTLIG